MLTRPADVCTLGWRLTVACWATGAIAGVLIAVLIDHLIPRRQS